nr:nucleolar protein 58-like [Tanacetum cinerariifolium]
ARHMLGLEYGEQDKKAVVLYEYETFKATKGELLLDTYIQYLQVINDLKKCGYLKDNYELDFKFLNNLQPEWKQYATMMRSQVAQVINDLKKCGYLKDNYELDFKFLNNLQPEWKQYATMMRCEFNFKFLNNLQPEWKQYATMMRQNKNLTDINIDALYNILKQNQGDVNDAMGSKKKIVMVTSDPLVLIAEKTNMSRSKEKVVVSLDSKGSEADDFSELKKITALLAKAFNRRKFYSKPTNNSLRTSSSSRSANKKQEFVKTDTKKVEKKDDEKKKDMSIVKCYNCKKEGHFAKDCKKAKEINANMVFMAQIEKFLSDSEASSSSADEKISEVSYYLSESKCEFEFENSECYDNSTNYSLFVNNDDDQEIFHDAIESASENFIENHIDSQKDYDKSDNRVEKANQQSKDFENQNKDLQDKYDVLKNQTTNFEMNNKELNEQSKELIEKKNDLLAQTKLLKEQLQVKHVGIYTYVECHEKYAKLEAERYEYIIRYSAYFDNNKQYRMQIADQQVLFDKMSVQMVELDKHVRDLKNTIKGIGFENPSYFEKAKDLIPTLYDEKVIGLGYTPMFLTHSDEALEIEKFKRSRENKIEFAYDYGNLNASYVNEKINFEDDYFQEIINPDFEKIDSPFQQTSSLKPYVPNVILEKIIIDLEDEVVNLLEKNLDTFSSVRRPRHRDVIWKKKGVI